MTVVATPSGASLVVVYQTGVSATGAPITSRKTLNNIVYSASEQAVYDAACALFSLSLCPIVKVYFRKTDELTDEEE